MLFRDLGARAETWGEDAQFETFYYDVKAHYDGKTWVDEETSCREICKLQMRVLPVLEPLLANATFKQLEDELDLLAQSDLHLLQCFRTSLDAMHTVVEEIRARLASDMPGALSLKHDFEAQITPSLQRSKALLQAMSTSTTHIAAY
jgi:hypothetical protein